MVPERLSDWLLPRPQSAVSSLPLLNPQSWDILGPTIDETGQRVLFLVPCSFFFQKKEDHWLSELACVRVLCVRVRRCVVLEGGSEHCAVCGGGAQSVHALTRRDPHDRCLALGQLLPSARSS
jgi:hypothetical protein